MVVEEREYTESLRKLIDCARSVDCISSEEGLEIMEVFKDMTASIYEALDKTSKMDKFLFGYQSNGSFVPGWASKLDSVVKNMKRVERLQAAILGALIINIILIVLGLGG